MYGILGGGWPNSNGLANPKDPQELEPTNPVLYRRGVSDPFELKPVWRRPNLTQVLEDTVGFGADQI